MNPIPEPAELFEAECNALGLYGLPEALPSGIRACESRDRASIVRGTPAPAEPDPAD